MTSAPYAAAVRPPAAVARGSRWCLLLLLALAVGGCANWRQSRSERQLAQATVTLQSRTDADSLAAAGPLSVHMNRAQALSLLSRAAAAAPERADLAWLQLRVCDLEPSCDVVPFADRLRSLDPGNGAGWLDDVSRASVAKDDAALDAALIALGRAERVDLYFTVLVGHLSAAAARTGKLPPSEALMAITGNFVAIGIPPFNLSAGACKEERLQRALLLAACRGIARALENGDADITEMIGVALAKRVWPQDSPEWNAAVRRRVVFDRRSALLGQISNRRPRSAAKTARYLALCVATRREQDVERAELLDAGMSPEPPI